MIDERTRATFEAVRRKAQHDGVDLLDAMDRAGLILTEAQINKQWSNCLEHLWLNIESQPVTALVQLGGGQNAPLDAIRGVLEYIEFFRRRYQQQSGQRT